MERFFQEVGTAYFWIMVVGVGTAVSLLSTLITKLVPRLGVGLAFWCRVRTKAATESQSHWEREFRAKVSVVASQPALIGSYLIRAYVLYICGAALSLLGLLGLFTAITPESVLLYGPKFSWSWWLDTFHGFVKVIFFITFGVQIIKLANQRYLIATLAEERLMDRGLEKLTLAASPAPPSAP